MEQNEISIHEILVLRALIANKHRWVTINEILSQVDRKVARRTIARTMLRFVKTQLAEQIETYPGHRYRLKEQPAERYWSRLMRAAEAFGVTLTPTATDRRTEPRGGRVQG